MKRKLQTTSPYGKLIVNKLDPGVFVVEIPETGQKISLGQPPDVVKRFQQVGYFGNHAVDHFILSDTKMQDESISWNLIEFPVLYALYLKLIKVNGNNIPSFFAGKYPTLIGLENDVEKALKMIKYGNYGVDCLEELDGLDIPIQTRDALKKEICGLAVDNEIKESHTFIHPVYLEENPKDEKEFSKLKSGIKIGRIGYNIYRISFKKDHVDVDVTLGPNENFRAPVEYKHLKFPVTNFGIWHTGEFDGMDPYGSCAHTSIIHKYEPILIDYPSNMTDIIHHNGLSKQSINTVIATHNHDDHNGAMVELFRRNQPCDIITTEPVKHTLIKKLAAQADLPESTVSASFNWTLLPFRKDNPYQTEEYNLDGVKITGHLSCHSVPTTVYTFAINNDGYNFTYGHFLDIVAFKRMQMLVNDSWMPQKHLNHLDRIIRKKKYNLIKYDAGCTSDAAVPFTVHGQWQDLVDSATEKSFRVFTHVNKNQLSKDYAKEGRFVEIGDLDTALRTENGRLIKFGQGLNPAVSFFTRAYQMVLNYFQSLMGNVSNEKRKQLIQHYAYAFANSPKQIDLNIGSFLIEQGEKSDFVYIIVRGRAEIRTFDEAGHLISKSTIGDGEFIGDIGVIARHMRMASVKSINRLAYLAIPGNLFREAMNALDITYEGQFKQIFERRLFFQSASLAADDVSTNVLNEIGRKSRFKSIKMGEKLISRGLEDNQLFVVQEGVQLSAGRRREKILGPALVGECEFFLSDIADKTSRLHSVVALKSMKVLSLNADIVRKVPVIVDNIRRIIRKRKMSIYQDLKLSCSDAKPTI
ncbi:MAG: cyclic nucleotide-binding domain-containing protein [Deltaproteobacteria bacterium]|nr:cyclic nucleotide-binding domain-containing protein [Deltaproteobacteria bacterium]